MIDYFSKLTRALRSDPHLREIAQGTVLAFVLKVIGSGLSFVFNIVVARQLGATGAGLYFLALAIVTIGSVIGRIGLDNTLLRFVAAGAAQQDWAAVKGVYQFGTRIVIVTSVVVTGLIYFLTPWVAAIQFDKPELVKPLQLMSLSILPFSLFNLQAESLKGLKRVRDAMLIQALAVPLLGLLLIVPLAQLFGVIGASMTYLLSTSIVAGLGVWAWSRAVGVSTSHGRFSFREIWISCRPLWGVSILNGAVLPWSSLLLLGIWATAEDTGIFGAALRLAMLVSFFLVAVNNVVAPKFANLYARNEIKVLGRVARQSASLLAVLATPILLVMIFAGRWVMSLYGEDFSRGSVVLGILALGQLVNAFCGPVANLLTMCGHEKKLRNAILSAALIQLIVSAVLIPKMGMEGAAIATAGGVIVSNLISVIYVRRFIKIAYPLKLGERSV